MAYAADMALIHLHHSLIPYKANMQHAPTQCTVHHVFMFVKCS